MRYHSSAVGLALAVLTVGGLASTAAAAKNQVPFRGTIQTFEVQDFTGFPTEVISTAVGSGNATHLGKFTAAWEVVVNFEINEATGEGVFTAANGDMLFTTIVGHGFATDDPDVILILEEQTIVGGTGRFEGATGIFARESLWNVVTGFTSGTFSGTICSPGANKR